MSDSSRSRSSGSGGGSGGKVTLVTRRLSCCSVVCAKSVTVQKLSKSEKGRVCARVSRRVGTQSRLDDAAADAY